MIQRIKNFANRVCRHLPQERYGIDAAYIVQRFPREYKDTFLLANDYQREVYIKAASLIDKNAEVLDIGCGSGLKLREFIRPHTKHVVGVDLPDSINYCRRHYAWGRWEVDDIEHPKLTLDQPVDLIVCADVIEHLRNPDLLIAYFRRFATTSTKIIISTPDREAVRSKGHMGPPPNQAHVREWSKDEFARYLSSRGLIIESHTLVKDVEGKHTDAPDRKFGKTCQMVVGRLKEI